MLTLWGINQILYLAYLSRYLNETWYKSSFSLDLLDYCLKSPIFAFLWGLPPYPHTHLPCYSNGEYFCMLILLVYEHTMSKLDVRLHFN